MNVSSYVEHRPAGLERWAECVWERSAGARPDVARVIPDGCMDVVFSEARGKRVRTETPRAPLEVPDNVKLFIEKHNKRRDLENAGVLKSKKQEEEKQ